MNQGSRFFGVLGFGGRDQLDSLVFFWLVYICILFVVVTFIYFKLFKLAQDRCIFPFSCTHN